MQPKAVGNSMGVVPPPLRGSAVWGRVALGLGLVPWLVLLGMYLLRPGRGSPLGPLAGVTILVSAPLAVILSVVALVRDGRKAPGILGMCVSVPAVLLILYGLLMAFVCGR